MKCKITLKNNQILMGENKISCCKVIKYPDGQRNIKLEMDKFSKKFSYFIECRITKFEDLELLSCLVAAMDRNDLHIDFINFKYLFGMRSDRAFEEGMPNYFKDIIIPILNSWNKDITINHPHSIKMISYINKGSYDSWDFFSLYDMNNYPLVIKGDQSFLPDRDFFYFIKDRDSEGKIISMNLKKEYISYIKNSVTDLPLVIIDDLCDGGATFIEGAKILKDIFPNRKLILRVYHGIFSKGFDELLNYFDKIYTTNSFREIDHKNVIVEEII